MLSRYFKFKVKTKYFVENLKKVLEELKDKKILVCAEKNGLKELDKRFKLLSALNIQAIIYQKPTKETSYNGIKIINYNQISDLNYDAILVTNEDSVSIYNKLFYDYRIEDKPIKTLFFETIKDGKQNLEYLLNNNMEKYFEKLKKKLKNKRVVIYGSGVFFELIHYYFDMSGINILGVADKKYKNVNEDKEIFGYKTMKPEQMLDINPDYVVVATKRYVSVAEFLYFGFFEDTKVKIIPIVKKNIFKLLYELSES